MLNHCLFEDHQEIIPSYSVPPNLQNSLHFGCNMMNHSLKTLPSSFAMEAPLFNNLSSDHALPKEKVDIFSDLGGPQLLSLQRSSSTTPCWAWSDTSDSRGIKRNGAFEDNHLGIASMKMKKMKSRRKVREPRFCFKTLSDVDVLDDGYKWRKYGQKVVKNTEYPRSYYRCTQDNCRVKKRVERLAEDPRMVITTYEGRHMHSPSQDEENNDFKSSSHHLDNLFW
ncbi:DNA-binding transcription factor [Lithospermum erythrorhizon]|uniref:DNA-binding transcription factor n=1 Tax=Lithospermum erythrorhizon TaxID=34254 RepID=A0AAV3NY76_LITER